ncbi:MAG: hypothetical protein Q9184_006355 [Pyrenodesmia sp. 2 TL-2023]
MSEDVPARRDTPAKPHREPMAMAPSSRIRRSSLPSDIRQTTEPSHSRADRRSSSSRPVLAEKCTNPANRPYLPKRHASQTENLLALIPKTLSPQATSQLLAELAKPVSEHDEEGYIYMFWLTTMTDTSSTAPDPSALLTPSSMRTPRHRRASAALQDSSAMLTPSPTPSPRHRRPSAGPQGSSPSAQHAANQSDSPTILLKIGRASNVQRRMNEWTRQCGYNLSLVRFYPYLPSSIHGSPTSPHASSAPQTPPVSPRKVPHAHKVERLIHLELAEKRVKRDCDTCGKEHREWFEVSGDREGVKAVDEVIRRWVGWAETWSSHTSIEKTPLVSKATPQLLESSITLEAAAQYPRGAMPSDKDRLYVALYVRGGEGKRDPDADDLYHWGLLVGPKGEDKSAKGFRFHAKNPVNATGESEWMYDEQAIGMARTASLLVRIVVAKVTDMDRLRAAIRSVPIIQNDLSWTCITWLRNALEAVEADGKAVGTSKLDWEIVRRTAKSYIQEKKDAHRFDGKSDFDMTKTATYDLLEGREIVA